MNYYNPTTVTAPGEGNPFPFEIVPMLDGYERTDMGWPVVPAGCATCSWACTSSTPTSSRR